MTTRLLLAVLLLAAALPACGDTTADPGTGTGGAGGAAAPTTHAFIGPGDFRMMAGQAGFLAPVVALPGNAVVTYSLTDTTPTATADHVDVGIISQTQIAAGQSGGQVTGYAEHDNVVSVASASTQPLPADAYTILVNCRNLVDDCFFSVTATAFY